MIPSMTHQQLNFDPLVCPSPGPPRQHPLPPTPAVSGKTDSLKSSLGYDKTFEAQHGDIIDVSTADEPLDRTKRLPMLTGAGGWARDVVNGFVPEYPGTLNTTMSPAHTKRAVPSASELDPLGPCKAPLLGPYEETPGDVVYSAPHQAVRLPSERSDRHLCAFGESYTAAARLRSHIDTKNDIRIYQCTYCPKAFARGDLRKKHERTHNINRVVCPGGGATCSRPNVPKRHLDDSENEECTSEARSMHNRSTGQPMPVASSSAPRWKAEIESNDIRRMSPEGTNVDLLKSNTGFNGFGDANKGSCDVDNYTYGGPQLASGESFLSTPYPEEEFERIRREATEAALLWNIDRRPTQPPRHTGERCNWCHTTLDLPDASLALHLQKHMAEIYEERWRCDDCQIFFAHRRDLNHHLQAARNGHCGFNFDHSGPSCSITPCTGHHPPLLAETRLKMPHESMQTRLREWEHLQLKAHRAVVVGKQAERARYRIPARMSVHADGARGEGTGRKSSLASLDSFHSVPAYVKMVEKLDVARMTSDLEEVRLEESSLRDRALEAILLADGREGIGSQFE